MRILVCQWGRRGAGPRFAYEMAKALVHLGTSSVYLSYLDGSEYSTPLHRLGLPEYVVHFGHSHAESARAVYRVPRELVGLRQFVAIHDIDVVYSPMSHPLSALLARCMPRRVKYIATVHDAVRHQGDGSSAYDWLRRREVHSADGVVVLSSHVLEQLRGYGLLRRPYAHIPHESFALPLGRRFRTSSDQTVRFLFLGRILPYKGLDLLLAAYQQVSLVRGAKASLVIAGSGAMGDYWPLISGLENVTVVNRWLTDADMADLFANCDVLVLPYKEASQSGILASAASTDIAILATPVDGLREQCASLGGVTLTTRVGAIELAAEMLRLSEASCLSDLRTRAAGRVNPVVWSQSAEMLLNLSHQLVDGTDAASDWRSGPSDR